MTNREILSGLQLPPGVSEAAACAVLDMARQWNVQPDGDQPYSMHEDEDLAYELGRLLHDHWGLSDELIAPTLTVLPIEAVVGKPL